MSDELAREPAAPPRRPIQFTVRTFFAAAVLVSLFAAAARLPDEKPRVCVLTFLAWLTAAGFFRIIRTRSLLFALVLAPLVLAGGWVLSLALFPVFDRTLREIELWMVVPGALVWGIELSIAVMLATGLARLGRSLGIPSGRRAGNSPFLDRRARVRSPAQRLALAMIALRLALSGIQALVTALNQPGGVWKAALATSFLLDGPFVPLYLVAFPEPPPSASPMILMTTALGVPLYAAMGWLVGRIAGGKRAAATLQGRAGADAPADGQEGPSEAMAETR